MRKKHFSIVYLMLACLVMSGLLAACGSTSVSTSPVPSGLEVVTAAPVQTTEQATTSAAFTTTAAPTTASVTTVPAATTNASTITISTATAIPVTTTAVTTIAATTSVATTVADTTAAAPAATPTLKSGVLLQPMSWVSQTWNNCAPVSAMMVLSYYGITLTQEQCAKVLRPNSGDKHVTPEEMVTYLRGKGLKTMKVENGSLAKLRALLSAGVPVITQQWLHDGDDIGHYRVARGYDLKSDVIIFNDSMDNKPQTVVSSSFQDKLWKGYDRRYFPVYTAKQEATVLAILGDDATTSSNLNRALSAATTYAENSPKDIDAWRNLGYLDYAAGDCKSAVSVWEQHISKMLVASDNGPYNRYLWYQLWPLECYNKLGNYQQVIKLAPNEIEKTKVYAEARYEYGVALMNVNRKDEAIAQFKKSVLDDQYYQPAYDMLAKLGVN